MTIMQTKFLKLLEQNPDGLTLRQAYEKSGIMFKSGHIMILIKNGLVRQNRDTRTFKLTKNVQPTETEEFRNTIADIDNYYNQYGIYGNLIK